MTAGNKDFTVHPYDTDAIEFAAPSSKYVSVEDIGSLEAYLRYKKDIKLIDNHPALKEAWDHYQVLLTLYNEDNNESK